ncbi:MAG: hypothetical protein RLZZ316_1956 [Bacteroidota bacterium]|jgi:multidrug resistance efflux pump
MEVTHQKIKNEFNYELQSTQAIYKINQRTRVKVWIWCILGGLVVLLFLPWTQNIRATGTVTTLYQQQRPQQINAIIPGRIVKWWVKEGDKVKKGDTLVQLVNVKDDYLDPSIVERTGEQIDAKETKVNAYENKIAATQSQIIAIRSAADLKVNQLQNKMQQLHRKVTSDSAELIAANIDLKQSKDQVDRAIEMFKDGVISKFDFERRNATYQKAQAAQTEKLNKLQNTKQDLQITTIEMMQVQQEAADKVFKAQGEIAGSYSDIAANRGDIAKLKIDVTNYSIRNNQLYILSPQDGQVIKAMKEGINEIIKDGEMLVEVVPDEITYAVELFVNPMDLTLINPGQKIRFMFDGFPAIVFSGWPKASYGTFGGEVVAVESNRSDNGKFRVLVKEDNADRKWPTQLKMGAGTVGFALIKDVPIWYELWRQINGFPPDYYVPANKTTKDKEKEK